MFAAIAKQWYKLHHGLIKKYEPNHLIIGDKHDVGYDKSIHMIPDGVLQVMGKYTNVLMIQSYSHYADQHKAMLEELHQKSGLPIINGDHSYSCMHERKEKTKGIKLESQKAVAEAYYAYMKSNMENTPTCWAGVTAAILNNGHLLARTSDSSADFSHPSENREPTCRRG